MQHAFVLSKYKPNSFCVHFFSLIHIDTRMLDK